MDIPIQQQLAELSPSEALALNHIKWWEGWRDHPYKDACGLWTIGWGHLIVENGKPVGRIAAKRIFGGGISKETGERLLLNDMQVAIVAVKALVKVPLTDGQRAALISFVYNVGVSKFKASTLLKLLNRGMYGMVPHELRKWVHANGKPYQGLIDRRESEIQLWNAN